jgi:hypothetical protein
MIAPVPPDGADRVTDGAVAYPDPPEETATAVIAPPESVTVTVACSPPAISGAPTVTAGAAAVEE